MLEYTQYSAKYVTVYVDWVVSALILQGFEITALSTHVFRMQKITGISKAWKNGPDLNTYNIFLI